MNFSLTKASSPSVGEVAENAAFRKMQICMELGERGFSLIEGTNAVAELIVRAHRNRRSDRSEGRAGPSFLSQDGQTWALRHKGF